MKRASYRHGVEWIALNDDVACDDDEEAIAGYVTVCLLADLFDITTERVARDVLRVRRREGLQT